jgi:hypothetical protein
MFGIKDMLNRGPKQKSVMSDRKRGLIYNARDDFYLLGVNDIHP